MDDSTLSRRAVLRGGALLAVGSLLPGFARRALAAPLAGRPRTLVFLFLRGALDGLHAVPPLFEQGRLAALRPQLAVPDAVALGSTGFGLHPALAGLLPLWKDERLALVHATGSPDPSRSHFDAQDELELGTPGEKRVRDGWLSRALAAAAPAPPSRLPAAAVAARLPRSLEGSPNALAFASLDQLRLRPLAGAPGGPRGRTESEEAFEALYASGEEPVALSGREAFAALQLLEEKLGGLPASDVQYPGSPLGRSLRQLAQLIKSDVGLRVGCAEAGGWDTHLNQAPALARELRSLGDSLAAFFQDLGPRADDVVLVAATEFGRTARQNGANGTDHGHGSVAFVAGGGVRGGRVHGTFPGLRDDQLFEGRDLAVTTDLRSVLAAAAAAQLGARDVPTLFPGFAGAPLASLIS